MWLLAWTSGHTPPRTMYHRGPHDGYKWGATEDIGLAERFKSPAAAINRWRSYHCCPDEPIYQQALRSGRVRAEPVDQGALRL